MGPITTSGYMHAEPPKQKPKFEGVHMGINYFKREIDALYPDLPKKRRNKLVAAYKKRSWMEFEAIAGRRMPIGPSRPKYGRIIPVLGTETPSKIYRIKVNGK